MIGNVERVANLFVAKNVMSLFAIVTAAAFAVPFPFLPRQLTLISALTIGIPAFFLALGPNKRRYIPGFLGRVLGFAVPAGVVAGSVSTLPYLWARHRHGIDGSVRCTLGTNTSTPVDPACWQSGLVLRWRSCSPSSGFSLSWLGRSDGGKPRSSPAQPCWR